MSINYNQQEKKLSNIIKQATENATIVIPDLQRPYVWSPKQVIYLVDSIFRKWPFGTILLWEVRSDTYTSQEGIPHRPFWKTVNRTLNGKEEQNSAMGQPATYEMVLDGQQRLQSLLLALGGDNWGFTLYDSEWAWDRQEREVKSAKHWSKASLCLDLVEFSKEVYAKNQIVRKIEIYKILDWVVIDHTNDQSKEEKKANYIQAINRVVDYPGRFIRLSRLWDLAENQLSEEEYMVELKPILEDHHVNYNDDLLKFLSQFMPIIHDVRNNTNIYALKINSFRANAQWKKDDYSDAIVNIFTRLNTAGRTLTKEEITLAWIKVGWVPSDTVKKSASECLDELKESFTIKNINLQIDEIVRLIAFIWSVKVNKGKLLDSNELLKGDSVRPMSKYISENWINLSSSIKQSLELLSEGKLAENYESFNSLIVFITWYSIIYDALEKVTKLLVPEKDKLEKEMNEISLRFLDRWNFSSMWSKVWADSSSTSFQSFANELKTFNELVLAVESNKLLTHVTSFTNNNILSKVSDKAATYINTFNVSDRKKVSQYKYMLWIWHRLDKERWQKSSITLREKNKRAYSWDVDHTVADAWWKRKVEEEINKKLVTFLGSEEEKQKLAPDGFESKDEAIEFINILGNCSLLEKSFNISRSDSSLWSFLKKVHEFQNGGTENRDEWEKKLLMNNTLTDPDNYSFTDIVNAIKERDGLMRKELVQFINGTLTRQDLT